MRIAVLGAGAIGILLAAILKNSGLHEVKIVGRKNQKDMVLSVELATTHDQILEAHVRMTDSVLAPDDADLVILAVKANQLATAIGRIGQAIPQTPMLAFQNGVGHMQWLRARYNDVSAASIYVHAEKVADPCMLISRVESGFCRIEVPPRYRGLFDKAPGFNHFSVSQVEKEPWLLWRKLTVVGPLALMTARYQTHVGDVRETYPHLLEGLVQEFASAANKHATFPKPGPEANLEYYFNRAMHLINSTPGGMTTSLQRDVAEGRLGELAWLSVPVEGSITEALMNEIQQVVLNKRASMGFNP